MAELDRPRVIVEAACELIAQSGLEGFRVRTVAKMAGCNHATLLHYFPSKKTLLEAVVEYLCQSLQQGLHSHPEFFVVLNELQLRALRDKTVSDMLNGMYGAWRAHLSALSSSAVVSQNRVALQVLIGDEHLRTL